MKILHFLLFLLLSFILGACDRNIPRLPSLSSFKPVSIERRQSFLEAVQRSRENIRSARLMAEVSLSKGVSRQKLREVLVFERPDNIRLEYFATQLNQIVSLVFVNDQGTWVIDPRQEIVYYGGGSESALEKLAAVPLSPEKFMLWSIGRIWVGPGEIEEIKVGKEEPFIRVEFVQEGIGKATCLMEERTCQNGVGSCAFISFLEFRDDRGRKTFVSKFDYDTNDRESDLPKEILFWLPRSGLSGAIKYTKTVLNPELSHVRERMFYPPDFGYFQKRRLEQLEAPF